MINEPVRVIVLVVMDGYLITLQSDSKRTLDGASLQQALPRSLKIKRNKRIDESARTTSGSTMNSWYLLLRRGSFENG